MRALDLGCGTGLSGAAFAGVATDFIGVDLSEQMLAKARSKNLYQQLIQADIVEYLTECDVLFDLILASDVVVYLGDLTDFLRLTAKRLAPAGVLLFSIETTLLKAPFVLTATGRFQHQLASLLEQAKSVGFVCLAKERVTLRHQDKRPVTGTILALGKSAK